MKTENQEQGKFISIKAKLLGIILPVVIAIVIVLVRFVLSCIKEGHSVQCGRTPENFSGGPGR